ncbi:MAG: transcription termination/antitermination protein NusG [Patescibacteria group bacterium]
MNDENSQVLESAFDKDGLLISPEPHWYALQSNVNNEDAAKKILEQKIANLNLQDKILEVYIPTKKTVKLNKKGIREEKYVKVHPGYLYVRAVLTKEIAYIIQSSSMITRIAVTGGVYKPLEEGYIEKVKSDLIEANEKVTVQAASDIKLGDTVNIVDGHFKHMQGKVCSVNAEGNRIGILLNMFDRETQVELDILEIEKVL